MANPVKLRLIGQLQRPGQAPEDVVLVVDTSGIPDEMLSDNVPLKDAANTWDLSQTFSEDLVIGNNVEIRWEDTGGTPRQLIFFDLSDDLIVGNTSFATALRGSTITANGSEVLTEAGGFTISGSATFDQRPAISSEGGMLFHTQSGNEGGAVTVSTSDPSGTPADGDIWIKREA